LELTMRQNIFETRQRAQELLEEVVNIWRQSPQSEQLEGMDKDPAMSLMISALAYQANETDSDIEMLKTEVLQEYVHMLTPYELGHAVPATAIIETSLRSDVSEWNVDTGTYFRLSGTDYQFMPILHTKVINARVGSITRIDGRRWRVDLEFNQPVKNLSGFTFAIDSLFFEDVKVSYKRYFLPIIKPWQYSKLPLAQCFSIDSALYNEAQIFDASKVAMDLFAGNNVRLFCIREHDAAQYMTGEEYEMSLVFEFSGITDGFTFDKKHLILNCIPIVDAQLNYVNLSGENPVARVAGYKETDNGSTASSQFLHLVRPSEQQLYGQAQVEVRRVSGDRFNQARLGRLLNALLSKYYSDFYAFQNQKELSDDNTLHTLQDILSKLTRVCQRDIHRSMDGVYLLLHRGQQLDLKDVSLNIGYLTTHGASINNVLNEASTFILPAAFDTNATRQVAPPILGSNEIDDKACEESLVRYHIITNDRIVTPADIKVFCYNNLMSRYGIDSTMVESVTVSHRMQADPHGCGYEVLAEIVLADNTFVRRSFAEKIPQIEILMEKLMEVRSANVYPIRVSISINEKQP